MATEHEPVKQSDGVRLPCAEDEAFGPASPLGRCLHQCLNCRREVEDSLTRVAGRKLRKLRALPTCSVGKCAEFLSTLTDEAMRLHLASMAWWRFSSDTPEGSAERIRRIMVSCRATMPEFGRAYMHRVLKELSRLSQEQLSAWFGNDNLYQIVSLFTGDRQPQIGPHCAKCRLYKLGCTDYASLSAVDCPFWGDAFVQGVAASVLKKGDWRDPCKGIRDDEKETA